MRQCLDDFVNYVGVSLVQIGNAIVTAIEIYVPENNRKMGLGNNTHYCKKFSLWCLGSNILPDRIFHHYCQHRPTYLRHRKYDLAVLEVIGNCT